MTKKLLFLFFTVIVFSAKGQNWAPLGATWYYTQVSAIGPEITFVTIQSIGDTILLGKTCKVLSGGAGCSPNETYLYSDSNKVFFYNNNLSQFYLLYDFNKNQGDSWIVNPDGVLVQDSIAVNVDSTSTEIINNDTLKVLYVTCTSTPTLGVWCCWGGKIIDRIGSMFYLAPQYGFCDPYTGPLRCYFDSVIGNYSTGFAPSCDWTNVGMNEFSSNSSFSIFPNPSSGILRITNTGELRITNIEVYNVLGEEICLTPSPSPSGEGSVLDLTNQPKGIYFVKVSDGEGNYSVKKIVID